jgi:hypothetical protein
MRTKLRSKVTLLFIVCAGLIAVPVAAVLAQDTSTPAAPTIQSDKADYAPGELVTLTGGGWQPGESVHINVNDTYGASWVRNADVTANANGQITDSFNLPDWFVSDYDVTATGTQSGTATTTFTDSNPNNVSVASPTNVSVTQGSNATYGNVSVGFAGSPGLCTVILGIGTPPGTAGAGDTGLPAGASPVFGSPLLTGDKDQTRTSTFAVSTTNSTPTGTYKFHVKVTRTGPSCNGSGDTFSNEQLTLVVNSAVTATSVSDITASASTFGGTTNLSAKVSPAGAPGSVEFFVNGSSAGAANYNSSTGVATLSNYAHGLAASNTPYSVKAVFTPTSGSNFSSSNATNASALTVNKANTTTTVTCTGAPFTYNGSAQTPCSATVTGPGGLNQAVTPVTYTNNTDAGTATASASYAGTANYNASSDTENFTIGKADTTTTITCTGAPFTYNGSAHTPCSAVVTGPGGLSQPLTVNYTNNTDAGTATASASYAGNGNYNASSDSKTFTIQKADATIDVQGYTGVYDGNLHGATGNAKGVNNEDLSNLLHLGASYTNVPGGPANWNFDGNGNYNSASGTVQIVITQATPQITWSNPAPIDYGTALSATQLNATANVSGLFSYDPPAGTKLLSGTKDLTVTFTPMDTTNYKTVSKTVQIVVNPYPFNGFFQPIDNGGVYNKAKIGSTIPVKFSLGGDKGLNIFAAGYPQVSKPIACGSNPAVDAVEEYSTATNSGLKYDSVANQYIYNWKTDSTIKAGECRQLIVKLADGSVAKTANFTFFK